MKKFINQPAHFVTEFLEGIRRAHSDRVECDPQEKVLIRRDAPQPGKVAIITGGGSGHLPLFLGYVGRGLCDGVAIGEVFQSPSADQIVQAASRTQGGAGVLFLFGNYSGDVMNFDMAAELLEMEGISSQTVLGTDDVASAPKDRWQDRRGVAGLIYAYKLAGAKAEQGASLDEVARIARETVANTFSIGVALSPCIIPEVGKPTFTIGEDEMEIGMGIHGEKGIVRDKLQPADDVTAAMMEKLLADAELEQGSEVAVMINGLGATPLEELYVVFSKVHQLLEQQSITVVKPYLGELATSMEMAGFSISLLRLDDERRALLAEPACSPFFCAGEGCR